MKEDCDFSIKMDFRKSSPQNILLTTAAYLDVLAYVDSLLLKTVAPSVQCSYKFSEIKSGSLWAFFISILKDTDDEELKKGNYMALIGSFLCKAKYAIIKYMEEHNSIGSRPELMELANSIHMLSLQSGIQEMQGYAKIPIPEIGGIAKQMSNVVQGLGDGESIAFQTYTSPPAILNNSFIVTQDDIDTLLIKRSIETPYRMILKVRKPDFLGNTKWDFRFNRQNISAPINDREWLAEFQNGKEEFRPGVSLEAECLLVTKYSYDNEVISEEYAINHVIRVIPPMEQCSLI